MRLLLTVLLLSFCLFGCEEQASTQPQEPLKKLAAQEDTIVTHVVQYADEGRRESVDRWLWNLMTSRNMGYSRQLNAARLWLVLNKHVECNSLVSEDSNYE